MSTSKDLEFEKNLRNILQRDRRYSLDAYLFVFEALEHTINKIGKKRHVTGRELLEGIREVLLERYGFLSLPLLERWGITKTSDFGEIVFNLVNEGLLKKTETDSMSDFENVFSLREELHDKFEFQVKDLNLSIQLKNEPLVSD